MYWTITIRDTWLDEVRTHLLEAKGYTRGKILAILEEIHPQWEIINLVEGGTPPKKKEE